MQKGHVHHYGSLEKKYFLTLFNKSALFLKVG